MTANHHIKHSFRRSVFIHLNDMAESAKPLYINTLSNVLVIEELIQKILLNTFLSNTPKAAVSLLDSA